MPSTLATGCALPSCAKRALDLGPWYFTTRWDLSWLSSLEPSSSVPALLVFFAVHFSIPSLGSIPLTSYHTLPPASWPPCFSPLQITGKPLFRAPRGRSWWAFIAETKAHGWPSFRDEEVLKDHVRILSNGEVISEDGTHLGHNIPDSKGNRFCINLVSVAWDPRRSKPP